METWKILLITLLPAVVLGCVIGIVSGKHQAKKAAGRVKPLLNKRERLIYSLCVLLGTACILFGIFVAPDLMSQQDDSILYDEFGNPVGGMAEDELAMEEGGAAADGGRVIVRGGGGAATAVFAG